MSSSRIFLNALLAATSLHYYGCKGGPAASSDSETKTLDNFAAGTTVYQNACVGSNSVSISEDRIRFDPKLNLAGTERTAMRTAVKDYFSSIPPNMQKVFVEWGGEVLITPDANSLCTKLFSDKSSDQYVHKGRESTESCYIYAEGNSKSRAIFTIIHAPDLKAIRHGGVRMFGYMFSQFFPRLVKNEDAGATTKYRVAREPSVMMSTFKLNLAESFLRDLVRGKRYDIANLDTFLGTGGGAAVKRNIDAGLDPFSNLTWAFDGEGSVKNGPRQMRQARFEDFVFAEAFDSFRCSSSSVAKMKTEFPETYAEFSRADKTIDQVGAGGASLVAAGIEDTDDEQRGAENAAFALQDGSMLPVGLQGSNILFYPVKEGGGIDTSVAITPTGPAARNKMADIAMFAQMAPQFIGLFQALGAAGAAGAPGGNCAGGGCAGGSCGSCGG